MNPKHPDPCPYNPCPQTRLVELGSAGAALWWTLLLFLPVHLFRSNSAFEFLPRIGPEWQWGISSLIVGVWQVAATIRRRPFFRWAGLCLAAGLWTGVGVCLAEGSRWQYHLPINTGCGVYGVFVLLAFASGVLLMPHVLADITSWAGRMQRHWTAKARAKTNQGTTQGTTQGTKRGW